MKRKLILFGVLFLSLFPLNNTYASEDSYSIIKNRGELEEELSSLSTRLDELNAQFNSLKNSESKVEKDLIKSTTNLEEKNRKKEESLAVISDLSAELDILNNEYTEALQDFSERALVLKNRLVTMQERNNTFDYVSILLDSNNLDDLINRITAIVTFIGADQDLLKQSLAEQQVISEKKEKLEQTREALANKKNELVVQINEIENEKAKQTEILSEIKDQQQQVLQEKGDVEKKNEQLLKEQEKLAKQLLVSGAPVNIHFEKGVPVEYLPYYISSGEKYGVEWTTLAAIHSIETEFSTHPTMVSSAFAVGCDFS
jgi:peptidoglycan hydrolase CwlO-like protein